MEFPPVAFYDEPVEPVFAEPPVREKTPPCPQGFRWRDQSFHVIELVAEWHDYSRQGKSARNMQPAHAATASRRGSWGVGKFFFRVRVEDGRIFDIYYDRAPTSSDDRKGHWFVLCERKG